MFAGSVFLVTAGALSGGAGIAIGAEAPADFDYARGYESWTTIHPEPIYSKSHGRRLVKTYLNPVAEQGLKTEPAKFPPGSWSSAAVLKKQRSYSDCIMSDRE